MQTQLDDPGLIAVNQAADAPEFRSAPRLVREIEIRVVGEIQDLAPQLQPMRLPHREIFQEGQVADKGRRTDGHSAAQRAERKLRRRNESRRIEKRLLQYVGSPLRVSPVRRCRIGADGHGGGIDPSGVVFNHPKRRAG